MSGIGPLLLGMMNDAFRHTYGDQGVRYTLFAVPVTLALSGMMFFFAGRTTDKDAAQALG